jgi:hypothetical protein
MKGLPTLLTLIAGALGLSFTASAGSPPYVPVQGVLTDSSGSPLDGSVDVRFAIHDSASGGSELWSETQTVLVENGLFTVYLGQSTPLDLSIFRTYDDLWLGTQVGADPEGPRIYLGSTPYSGHAAHSSYSAGSGISISGGNVISATLGTSIDTGEIADGTIRLADLGQNGCSTDQIMKWNGSAWACADPAPVIPAGFCMFSATQSSCPSGWTRAGALDGSTLRGSASPGGTGGSDTHQHSTQNHTLTVAQMPSHSHYIRNSNWQNGSGEGSHRQGDSTSGDTTSFSTLSTGSGQPHNHGNTNGADSWPPYTNVIVCCKN